MLRTNLGFHEKTSLLMPLLQASLIGITIHGMDTSCETVDMKQESHTASARQICEIFHIQVHIV